MSGFAPRENEARETTLTSAYAQGVGRHGCELDAISDGEIAIHRLAGRWLPAWEAFVDRMPGATLAHDARWSEVISYALGHEDRSLIAERGGQICGILPMMLLKHWWLGTFHVSLPWLDYGGIVASDEEACSRLVDTAVEQATEDRASFIEFRSVRKVRRELPTRDDRVTFLLELGPPEAVWGRLDSKVRNQVRKAQRTGLKCEFGGGELLREFYQVFARNMRDLGTPVWGISLFQRILEAYPGASRVALVRLGEKAIGGGLILHHKDVAYMPSASSLRQYFHLCPNNLLYWEVIKRACETGYKYFDFGRSRVGSGTFHFKQQWGPLVKPLSWQYALLDRRKIPQLNPSNPRLRVLIEVWKRLPPVLTNWLGPRIVRHLP